MDGDGWPAIQLLVSLVLLCIFSLSAGVMVEHSSPKDVADSGIGVSHSTAASFLLCAVTLMWSLFSAAEISRSASLLLVTGLNHGSLPLHSGVTFAVLALVFILSTLLIATFFVVLPLSWGRAKSEVYAQKIPALVAVPTFLAPLAKLVTAPARQTLRRRGISGGLGAVTEEDVMDDLGILDDIDDNQKEMIGNIFDLDDITAVDIMTHRVEVEAVSADATVEEITLKAVETGYSRLPVCDGSLDNIIGTLSVKDLLPYVGRDVGSFNVRSLLREMLYVHESCRARDLLIEFKTHKLQLAVVVDEYGGTAGIVSMEDILESIVGDIEDEYDDEEPMIMKLPDNSFICDGYAEIDDVFDALGLEEPPDDLESDTVGGLLTALLGRIPQNGEHASAEYCGALLVSLASDERRITSVKARNSSIPEQISAGQSPE
ncbi:MAG: hemolysin family protein [Oscillospiraceae bacterium]